MAAAGVQMKLAVGADSNRSRRTEAMPKVSLFGSSLEMLPEETARSVRGLDPSKISVPRTPGGKGPGQKFSLPEDVRKQLPAAAVLEKSRRDFETQRDKLSKHSDEIRRREEQVLYEQSRVQAPPTSQREAPTDRPQWYNEQDLRGSHEINNIGLNENSNFNRDKYGKRPPVHNYTLIGDVLRPGMDFPRRERSEIQMRNQGYGSGDLRGILAEPTQTKKAPALSARTPRREPMTLPQNIKHQFGSKVCDNVFSDKDVVQKTINDQKEAKAQAQRRRGPVNVPKFIKADVNSDYEMLGNALRMSVAPGYSIDNKVSTTKTAFNDQTHLFRHPDPDKWRYQKDELSRWAEHNVLRQRMTKAWEAYFVETLQKKNQPQ
ncbi:uncharacterized protein LOC128244891 isoform X2 [Mya arenaria]|uniref:uncharacterized protein LOC128244891 isoform X2 n=1 Tax=Mya arenaria TaxID=6604 RepID=UPI0022E8B424|nr:uncharacterized protein LOC128244891 isoform X2 [Mya arenaria]